MNIVKHETVELSAEEKKAFDFVGRMLENIANSADDDNLIERSVRLSQSLYQFYVYLKVEDKK
jgi:hypothetical protein